MTCTVQAQDISLYQQFNGKYDFTFIGNTLNTVENNNIDGEPAPACSILTSSSAILSLSANDVVYRAYLYWAGSGLGDFDVKLNGISLSAQRSFNITNSAGRPCFSAFRDITSIIQSTGNGNYTFSDLDLTAIIDPYCPNGGNFGGWAVVIVFTNPTLAVNQLNVYDGMQGVPDTINITLNSLNVIDNQNAKIGFVAWEGDKNIAVNESLTINGMELENLPLNPANNAFNGTNSITNSDQLYNMDLDVYDIQNNIQVGDTTAEIQLTSSQDFVMINCIVSKLNSQLPDASINIDGLAVACNSRKIVADYTVYNTNATAQLQGGVPIAIYANGVFIQYTETLMPIAVNGSESGSISLVIPETVATGFELQFVVDDVGTGQGIVIEIDEANNSAFSKVEFVISKALEPLSPMIACNAGLTKGTFNFSVYEDLIKINPTDVVSFYPSATDLQNHSNSISSFSDYSAPFTPMTIFVKVDNGICFSTTSFLLTTTNCPPTVYNYVSANNDSKNDVFFIEGLRDIFVNFKLSIFNRWGKLIWMGDNNSPDWNGFANKGLLIDQSATPDGTYYYELQLNDVSYPKPLVGFLFLTTQ
ncbi:MAG: gliding motility-associated C-terminal domain-containing protein [Burkholderiales bacterium]|nr:gliding motility-associated C-terminal domain-containing protein [Flavobacterium sp.]